MFAGAGMGFFATLTIIALVGMVYMFLKRMILKLSDLFIWFFRELLETLSIIMTLRFCRTFWFLFWLSICVVIADICNVDCSH